MSTLSKLFDNNRIWATQLADTNPGFFDQLAAGQSPEYLWIGCSDSRVPATSLTGLLPGEIFVHRNIANQVIHSDSNCESVIQYAVDVLKVKHIIVCGHYLCGGVIAGMGTPPAGPIDGWLDQVKALYQQNREALDKLDSDRARSDRMCELNVARQVINLATGDTVKAAWERGQELSLHGLIYSLENGLISDLELSCNAPADASAIEPRLYL